MKLVVTSTAAEAQAKRARGQHAVTAEQYLAGTGLPASDGLEVENRAGDFHYQSAAYYCSLIAEARGHSVRPSMQDICDSWHSVALTPPASHRPGENRIAILHEAAARDAPSDERSNRYFCKLARRNGIDVEVIGPSDLPRLSEFDGLWIRCLTIPHGIGYVFARQAETLGIPVIDDSRSILRCGNKVFAAERLRLAGVPAPKTLIIDDNTKVGTIEAELSYPIVLKGPDGSFSRSVIKACDRASLVLHIGTLRARSHLILAQEYMPTAFDWRIGVLAGQPIYACQYRMARGHWQIIKHRSGRRPLEGTVAGVPLGDVPQDVITTAVKAAEAMGDGLYGVDLKQTDRGVCVIEVNDNPDIMRGIEDRAEGEKPWLQILGWFGLQQMKRMARQDHAGDAGLLAARA